MYSLSDTIVAVSSPGGGVRSIIRITGPQTLSTCEQLFESTPNSPIRNPQSAIRNSTVVSGSMRINDELVLDARLYLFFAPQSYTGEDLAELHVQASPVLVEALMRNLLAGGLRPAGPGEFTARAYLNGKLDLAQAEAVNEIVSSSNRLQLEAAQKLLSGRLTQTAEGICAALLDCLSLLEAGLDFSGEDIEFISAQHAAERLAAIQQRLEDLRAGSIRYETLVDLPAIGVAGAPNAGKSSLLNALLGWERSIVSDQPKTTRDVLQGVLTTDWLSCVLFDCAGLLPAPDNVLDELAQRAALEALRRCTAVLFCVDVTKADLREDVAVRAVIPSKSLIGVATKCDLLAADELSRRMARLAGTFGVVFLPTSAKTGQGRAGLLDALAQSAIINPQSAITPLALTARHKQAVTEAIEHIRQASVEVRRGNEEVAALMLRAAHQAISQIEQQHLDEQILDRIFSRFCIGK